jgi:hypothetical protein
MHRIQDTCDHSQSHIYALCEAVCRRIRSERNIAGKGTPNHEFDDCVIGARVAGTRPGVS